MSAPTPNVIIFQEQVAGVTSNKVLPVIEPPKAITAEGIDSGNIDIIRNQQLPNEIEEHTTSPLKKDIEQMVKLLSGYCSINAIAKIQQVVKEIHDTLNSKKNPELKQWVRQLTGLHPKIDQYEKSSLDYWKNVYSEGMGTNTILYSVDTSNIDIKFWTQAPPNQAMGNLMTWTLAPWEAPTYIREGLRQKLDSEIVEFIQAAGHITAKYFRRNVIFDAMGTTKEATGGEEPQVRPVEHGMAHGASLVSDTYHQKFRIIDGGELNKFWGKQNAIYKLDSSGYFVHVLINHLEPLINGVEAADYSYTFKKPLGIETDTFPKKAANLTFNVNQSDEPVLTRPTAVNDAVIKPEIVEYNE